MNLLTIFTPTYNRASLINRLYESLKKQTMYKFEWIIVDDESVDNTDIVVKNIINSNNKFPITYLKQKHGGKHRAINLAVKQAKGDFFFIVDSDDELTIDAVEKIDSWTETIREIQGFCGVAGVKISRSGTVWGETYSNINEFEYVDATALERKKYHLTGDKSEVFRTDVLKKYPFPEFDGEFFVTESVCWNAIAADGLKMRWFMWPIYVCDYLEDGLTKNGANERKGHINNFKGYSFYVMQVLKLFNSIDSITEFREYNNTCRDKNMSMVKRAEAINYNVFKYLIELIIKMPFLYGIRYIKKIKMKLTRNS